MWLFINLAVSVLALGVMPPALILVLARRWDWWPVWAYAAISTASLVVQTLVMHRQSPALLKARMTDAGGRVQLRADRAFVTLSILQWAIAGLDQRSHWSDVVPLPGIVAGLAIVALSWGLATWSVWHNAFFSPAVRLQPERGQRVIREGPYSFMRHPGYAGIALSMAGSALALNSLLSFLPAALYLAVTVHQIVIEDRMLQAGLADYAEYAAKVRYRLIPGVW